MDDSTHSRSPYAATTRDITVTVQPYFLEDQSVPDAGHFVWAYHVRIQNDGALSDAIRGRRKFRHHHTGLLPRQPALPNRRQLTPATRLRTRNSAMTMRKPLDTIDNRATSGFADLRELVVPARPDRAEAEAAVRTLIGWAFRVAL